MKLIFLAAAGPASYQVNGTVINGINFALFTEGSKFIGDEQTKAAHIYGAEWLNGELMIRLAQPTKDYEISINSHDWSAGEPIDASEYDSQGRYVRATNPQAIKLLESGDAEYWRDPTTGAWTVRLIQPEAQNMEPPQ